MRILIPNDVAPTELEGAEGGVVLCLINSSLYLLRVCSLPAGSHPNRERRRGSVLDAIEENYKLSRVFGRANSSSSYVPKSSFDEPKEQTDVGP